MRWQDDHQRCDTLPRARMMHYLLHYMDDHPTNRRNVMFWPNGVILILCKINFQRNMAQPLQLSLAQHNVITNAEAGSTISVIIWPVDRLGTRIKRPPPCYRQHNLSLLKCSVITLWHILLLGDLDQQSRNKMCLLWQNSSPSQALVGWPFTVSTCRVCVAQKTLRLSWFTSPVTL